MKIFISNSILQFKSRFIPGDCVILPIPKFGGVNKTIVNIRCIKPTEIICETKEILRVISPYFNEIPVSLISYSNGIEYCPNLFKQNAKYIILSSYFSLFVYSLILDNFILSIFLLIIHLSVFIVIVLWYSDSEKWNIDFQKIVHV